MTDPTYQTIVDALQALASIPVDNNERLGIQLAIFHSRAALDALVARGCEIQSQARADGTVFRFAVMSRGGCSVTVYEPLPK